MLSDSFEAKLRVSQSENHDLLDRIKKLKDVQVAALNAENEAFKKSVLNFAYAQNPASAPSSSFCIRDSADLRLLWKSCSCQLDVLPPYSLVSALNAFSTRVFHPWNFCSSKKVDVRHERVEGVAIGRFHAYVGSLPSRFRPCQYPQFRLSIKHVILFGHTVVWLDLKLHCGILRSVNLSSASRITWGFLRCDDNFHLFRLL